MRVLVPVLIFCAAAVPCGAQNTWVVDKDGGPGAHFNAIQPAVDAAAPGDTIILRNSNTHPLLTGAVVNKPLSIIGAVHSGSGPGLNACTRLMGFLEVRDVPAGQRCLLSSICVDRDQTQIGPPEYIRPWGLHVHDCAGQVHIERMSLAEPAFVNGRFLIEDCAEVFVQGDLANPGQGFSAPGTPITIRRSNVVFSGQDVYNRGVDPVPPPIGISAAVDTMHIEQSHVRIIESVIRGADAQTEWWSSSPFRGTHAIFLDNSTLEVGPDCVLLGGYSSVGSAVVLPAISGINNSQIVFDTRSLHTGISGVLPVLEDIDSIGRGQVVRNEPYRVELYGPRSGLAILVGGGTMLRPIAFPFGDVWLDPSWARTMTVVPLDQDGKATLRLFAPEVLPMNFLFGLQAAMLAQSGELSLSGPSPFSVQWRAGLVPP